LPSGVQSSAPLVTSESLWVSVRGVGMRYGEREERIELSVIGESPFHPANASELSLVTIFLGLSIQASRSHEPIRSPIIRVGRLVFEDGIVGIRLASAM
jgi:hypothetical protein